VRTPEENASEVLLISGKGQAIRVGLKDIPVLGRTTQGVRIMKMSEGDTVSSIGLVPEKTEEDEVAEATDGES
jgi:DNA gyrase subunit A